MTNDPQQHGAGPEPDQTEAPSKPSSKSKEINSIHDRWMRARKRCSPGGAPVGRLLERLLEGAGENEVLLGSLRFVDAWTVRFSRPAEGGAAVPEKAPVVAAEIWRYDESFGGVWSWECALEGEDYVPKDADRKSIRLRPQSATGSIRFGLPRAGGTLVITTDLRDALRVVLEAQAPAWLWVGRLGDLRLPAWLTDERNRPARVVLYGRTDQDELDISANALRRSIGAERVAAVPASDDDGLEELRRALEISQIAEAKPAKTPQGSKRSIDGGDRGRHDEDDEKILPTEPDLVARQYLKEVASPPGGYRFRFAYAGGRWYWWREGCYRAVADDLVVSNLRAWLTLHKKEVWKGKGDFGKWSIEPFKPSRNYIGEVIDQMKTYCYVELPEQQLSAWLPRVRNVDGEPVAGAAVRMDELVLEDDTLPAVDSLTVDEAGMYDIDEIARTGVLSFYPHTTDFFTLSMLPHRLLSHHLQRLLDGDDEDAVFEEVCPAWHRYTMNQWGHDHPEMYHQLRCQFGDTFGNNRSEEFVNVLIGKTRSGKGTTFAGLTAALGVKNICPLTFSEFDDRHMTAKLPGKRAIVTYDATMPSHAVNWSKIAEFIKLISSNEPIPVRPLYRDTVDMQLGARWWVAFNELPHQLQDHSGAIAGRMRVIKYYGSYLGKEDPGLKAAITAEGQGIMLWAIWGLILLRREHAGRIPISPDSMQEAREYEEATAPLHDFVVRFLEQGDEKDYITSRDLMKVYKAWCSEQEQRPMRPNRLSRLLRDLLRFTSERADSDRVGKDMGLQPREVLYVGIRFTDVAEGIAHRNEDGPLYETTGSSGRTDSPAPPL